MVSMMLVKLSPKEQLIYDIIPESGKRITTQKIIERFYGSKIPLNGRIMITGVLQTLEKKTSENPVQIKRGKRKGPHPMEVWKEKKKRK